MDSYVYQTIEFAHPKMDHINEIITGLQEDLKYLKNTALKGISNINTVQKLEQTQQQVNSSNSGEVFFKGENQEDDQILPTQKYCDQMLWNVIPKRIEDAIQLIKQFTSNSYQQVILGKGLKIILFKNGSPESPEADQQFLANFQKSWESIKLISECKYQDANRYTSVRENIQSYYPEKQIYNHIFGLREETDNITLINKLRLAHQFSREEMHDLRPMQNGPSIKKPLVKINKIREHLMQYEPIKNFYELGNIQSSISQQTSYVNIVRDYEKLMESFKILEHEAYTGARTANLQ